MNLKVLKSLRFLFWVKFSLSSITSCLKAGTGMLFQVNIKKAAEFLNSTELKFNGRSTNTILLMYMYMAVQKAALVSLGTFTSNAS